MEQLFLTVEFQSINVKEMMEVKKKKTTVWQTTVMLVAG